MKLTSYLFVDGKALEMLTFYKAALGGEIETIPYAGTPAAAELPPAWVANRVLWGAVHSPFGDICVMDAPPGRAGMPGDNFALEIMCPDKAQVSAIFAKLGIGGAVMMPLDETFFSPYFGMLKDRYGTVWMVSAGRTL